MIKKLTGIALAVCIITVSACSPVQSGKAQPGKITVSVTFNALKEFVYAVGGDKVAVSVIIPDGTEPHDFEPKAQDLAALKEADVLVINGLGMEPWAEDAANAAGNSNLLIIDASNGVDIIPSGEGDSENSQHDPHIWLSLKSAEIESKNITDALVKLDPDNTAYYESNYNAFAGALDALYKDYSEKFEAVTGRNFVTGHAAFAYLCRDFDLNQNSVEDVFAEGEPSAQQLASLIDYCKANGVTTIFSEALENPDVADTLAREAGAQVKPIYTIESVENGKTYLERMEENLKVIYESLAG